MVDYQASSDKSKPKAIEPKPEKKVEKVVSGEVVVRKPGVGARFKKIFLGGDLDSTAHFLVGNVLLPALRNLVVEMVNKGADALVYGQGHAPRRPPSYAPRVQYHNPTMRHEPRGYSIAPSSRWQDNSRPSDRVTVYSKADADAVLDQMFSIVEQYGVVSVADLNEMIGQASSHVDHKWGWDNLARAEVRQTKDGYDITFPPVEEIQ